MKLKFYFLLFLFFGFSCLKAQSFYEINWNSDNVNYTALVIYYDTNDITVRVKYKLSNGVYKVAEYKCKTIYLITNDGKKHYVYDGSHATVVYSSNSSDNSGYVADNFIFANLNAKNEFESLHTIDDDHLQKNNYKDYLKKATFKKLNPSQDFSIQYLRNYFEEYESVYQSLVSSYLGDKSNTSDSYRISSLNNGNDQWSVVMSKGTRYSEQAWNTSKIFPQDWIKEYWDKNHYITSLSYGNGEWVVVVSSGTNYTNQTWSKSATFPLDWIKEYWDKDFYITSFSYGNGVWIVVMSKGTEYTNQAIYKDTSYPQSWIKGKWDEGYHISSVGYGDGEWRIAMSKGTGYKEQIYCIPTQSYPKDWIKSNWNENYEITSIVYGKGGWNVVMSKGTGYVTQSYTTNSTYPSTWIKNKWNETNVPTTINTANNSNIGNDNATPTIYLIVAADTKDSKIGTSCNNDKNNIINLMKNVGKELNINIETVTLTGTLLTKENIINNINNLSISSNDVIMFYYTGHGYNKIPKASDFPFMQLRDTSYKLEDVYSLTISKGPRLALVVGDLCNSVPSTKEGTGRGGEIAFKSSYEFDYNKLYRLFIKARGSLISTSSNYNEFSYCLPNGKGEGAFTKSFISSMQKEASVISGSLGDWNNIFNTTYSATFYNTSHIINQNGRAGQNGFNRNNISY